MVSGLPHGSWDRCSTRALTKVPAPQSNDLTVAHHVLLFYGLQLTDQLEIADDMTAVPLDSTEAFLNRQELEAVAPHVVRGHGWRSVGAILRPVQWAPSFVRPGDESEPELDWGGSFFADARSFVELLSLSHAVPVVALMDISYCIHRNAALLLGLPHYHSGPSYKTWALSFGALTDSNDVDVPAFDRARQLFLDSEDRSFGHRAPLVSRLAEALARTGQYAADDKILDVAIVLEQMYELDQPEISYKLKTRAACFLESDAEDRLRVFKDVEALYEARSSIVHQRKSKRNKTRKRTSEQAKPEAFEKGFRVARDSVFKLLREGAPPDWNTLVLGGREP